ncbi:unnamed protein product [Paramecium octaurelia]|uniref:Uncharacterized protein n=1 Tax=Paramecium octaurelia TaxID=43137 RepID=A0A8S1YNQ5_PAROT|nr:unnamed protein product [Paramecium octaurelia]
MILFIEQQNMRQRLSCQNGIHCTEALKAQFQAIWKQMPLCINLRLKDSNQQKSSRIKIKEIWVPKHNVYILVTQKHYQNQPQWSYFFEKWNSLIGFQRSR